MCDKYKKIGISGGTFDPIHYGHLIMAEEIREKYELNCIMFIPSGIPPHKSSIKVTDSYHRLKMVELAVETNPFFRSSTLEIDRSGYTYTIDTLNYMHRIYGNSTELYFIIGADVIPELITWKNFETVFTLCEFIATFRPGIDRNVFKTEIDKLNKNYSAKIQIAEVPSIEISSTQIREKVRKGESIKYLMPENVEKYIYDNNLYKN